MPPPLRCSCKSSPQTAGSQPSSFPPGCTINDGPSSPHASGVASVPAGAHRPPHILPSPSPSSERRRVVSCVRRLEVPSFLNLDGAQHPIPCSPSPPTSEGWMLTKEKVAKVHEMMSKEDKCCHWKSRSRTKFYQFVLVASLMWL